MTTTAVRALAAALLSAPAAPALAFDLPPLAIELRARAAPQGTWDAPESPFAPAAVLAGIGRTRGQGEVDARLRLPGLTADVSWRFTALEGSPPDSRGVLNELFGEPELLGQHLTLGKKVLSWDVGFAFRPLDVVQQEDRRALLPFALEGVPLVAWERFGESSSTALVYANPLRGRGPSPRDDEAVALRHYQRLGGLDLHALLRLGRRNLLQGGLAGALVLGEAVELHGSALWSERLERITDARLAPGAPPISIADPARVRVSPGALAALAGLTVTPGADLSFLAEGFIDPEAPGAAEWRALAALARAQRALLGGGTVPAPAVLANLAWGARAFDRPNLVRENVFLRVSQRWDRLEPALDLLWTPCDGGLVATAGLAWEGERSRLAAALRAVAGPRDAAARLLPKTGWFLASWEQRW